MSGEDVNFNYKENLIQLVRQLGVSLPAGNPEDLSGEECKAIILGIQKELDKAQIPFTKVTPHPEVKF